MRNPAPTCFQDYLRYQDNFVEKYQDTERKAFLAVTNAHIRNIAHDFGLVLDYLEDEGYPEDVIAAATYLYKRYYLSMAAELRGFKIPTRRLWWSDYWNDVGVRAEENYEPYKTLIITVDNELIPMEVKI